MAISGNKILGNGYITLYYNVTDTSSTYKVYNSWNHAPSNMVVDGKKVSVATDLTFNSTGTHIVEVYYDFGDSTDVGWVLQGNQASKIDMTNLATPGVSTIAGFFASCTKCSEYIGIPEWISTIGTEDLSFHSMFSDNYALTNLSFLDNMELSPNAILSLSQMFKWCTNLTTADLKFTQGLTMGGANFIFDSCTNLTSATFYNDWDIYTSTNPFAYSFADCPNLSTIRFYYPIVIDWYPNRTPDYSNTSTGLKSSGTLYYKSGTNTGFLSSFPSGWSKRTF